MVPKRWHFLIVARADQDKLSVLEKKMAQTHLFQAHCSLFSLCVSCLVVSDSLQLHER